MEDESEVEKSQEMADAPFQPCEARRVNGLVTSPGLCGSFWAPGACIVLSRLERRGVERGRAERPCIIPNAGCGGGWGSVVTRHPGTDLTCIGLGFGV